MFRWLRKKTLDAIAPPDQSEIRKRTKVLVIDDDPQSFPTELFQKDGYSITFWPSILSLESLTTNKYDIIILDIVNIANDMKTDGLGIIKHIKKENPAQLVIAFSGSRFV